MIYVRQFGSHTRYFTLRMWLLSQLQQVCENFSSLETTKQENFPGPLLMLGQFADALFTGIIGFLTDLYSTKRSWHLIGSIMVTISFPLIFILHRDILPYWACMFYLAFMIVLFQCGWATVQVSRGI